MYTMKGGSALPWLADRTLPATLPSPSPTSPPVPWLGNTSAGVGSRRPRQHGNEAVKRSRTACTMPWPSKRWCPGRGAWSEARARARSCRRSGRPGLQSAGAGAGAGARARRRPPRAGILPVSSDIYFLRETVFTWRKHLSMISRAEAAGFPLRGLWFLRHQMVPGVSFSRDRCGWDLLHPHLQDFLRMYVYFLFYFSFLFFLFYFLVVFLLLRAV
jgi:hypothetical protein